MVEFVFNVLVTRWTLSVWQIVSFSSDKLSYNFFDTFISSATILFHWLDDGLYIFQSLVSLSSSFTSGISMFLNSMSFFRIEGIFLSFSLLLAYFWFEFPSSQFMNYHFSTNYLVFRNMLKHFIPWWSSSILFA